MTAFRRLDAPSFVLRFSMWFLAVYQLTPNSSPIYLVSQPSARDGDGDGVVCEN